MPAVTKLTYSNFEEELEKSELPVLAVFWSMWSKPCKAFNPIIDQIAAERSDIKVCSANLDEEMELAGVYNITLLPTVMVMYKGKRINKTMGARPKPVIIELIDNALDIINNAVRE